MLNVDLGRGGRPLRIAYGRIFHEANAYSPLRTEQQDFERLHHLEGAALAEATELRGVELKSFMPHAELTGFRQAARLAGGVETVPLSSSFAVPSGPLTAECFAWLLDTLCDKVRAAGALDGIYLALHGSMQVEGLGEAPEAVILRRVREAAGPGPKLAVSYDLHANLSAGLVEPCEVLIAYRSNPHWDLAPTGFRAGNRLIRALRGKCRPVHAWRKLPMVLGGGITIDFLAPMRGVFRYLKRLERDPRVLSTSLFMVHPYTSAEALGWAVHVCTDGDAALAEELADALADRAWAERHVTPPPMRRVDEALDEVKASPWRRLGPITLVDVDDIVGAGAPGGNTRIAAALAADDRGLRAAYVPVHDPALVAALWDAPLGSRRACTLRGTPGYDAPEVALEGTVAARATTDFGRGVRLDVGGLCLVATERPPLPIHPSFWTSFGLAARDADLIVQKNFFHYRMFYATTSFRHLPVVSDGATSLERVRTRSYGLPMHPATELADWRPSDPLLRRARGTT
ncbi:MAG: M81 family metallopeptidase [Polyangiaceae bacterium]|nr:M81 family metallopeptidase [Polyangiaceae bacterium]